MQAKMVVFGITFLLGGMGVMLLTDNNLGAVFAWFLLFGIGQFFLFRCPNCRRVAFLREHGVASPVVGDRCRHCGHGY